VVLSDDASSWVIADAIWFEQVPVESGVFIVDNDDPEASYVGTWPSFSNPELYDGDGQYHASGTGSNTATWTPDVDEAGEYRVYAWWNSYTNRATDAPYTINYDGGSDTIDVDQQVNGGQWNLLGTYPFAAGTSGYVVLSDNANGVVIADAIKLESVDICGAGIFAPNVVGDNATYGFYVTGHNIDCLACHDASQQHIDHQHRTYESASGNYQVGHRLAKPMVVPRPLEVTSMRI
jgi:hypothetical protein